MTAGRRGRPSGEPQRQTWGRFVLCPAGTDGRTQHEIVVTAADDPARVLQVWPAQIVNRNLAILAAELRADWMARDTHDLASINEIEQWVALTRSLAARLPYGGGYAADAMRDAADIVEGVQAWPRRHFRVYPSGRREEFDFRFNLVLWTIDGLRRALHVSHEAMWNYLAAFLDAAGAPPFNDDSLRMRCRRIADNIVHGHEAAVMAYALEDAIRDGPLLPDGTIRPGTRIREQQTNATPPK